MADNLPLVSIGVPTFNRPESLHRTLTSLLGQSYSNIEVIVSDNNSPGADVEAVVRQVMATDDRVRFFKQAQNIGPLANFDFVLSKATGQFFMWSADDDHRERDFVQTLLAPLLSDNTVAISFCDFQEVLEDGSRAPNYPDHFRLLDGFSHPRRLVRSLRYFVQPARLGKANLVYGLFRRTALMDFEWQRCSDAYGNENIDQVFVYKILQKGRVHCSNRILYRCTTENVKHYNSKSALDSSSRTFDRAIRAGGALLREIFGVSAYWRLSDASTRAGIAISFPFRVVSLAIVATSVTARSRAWYISIV